MPPSSCFRMIARPSTLVAIIHSHFGEGELPPARKTEIHISRSNCSSQPLPSLIPPWRNLFIVCFIIKQSRHSRFVGFSVRWLEPRGKAKQEFWGFQDETLFSVACRCVFFCNTTATAAPLGEMAAMFKTLEVMVIHDAAGFPKEN